MGYSLTCPIFYGYGSDSTAIILLLDDGNGNAYISLFCSCRRIQINSPKNWVLSYILPPQCQRVAFQQQRSAGFMNVFVETEQVA